MIDKQIRRKLAEEIKDRYLDLDIVETGKEIFTWLEEKQKIASFVTVLNDMSLYYKGHPDGVLDSLAVYVYFLFMEHLEKAIDDQGLDDMTTVYARSIKVKVKNIMDDILHEATNSADNFPEFL